MTVHQYEPLKVRMHDALNDAELRKSFRGAMDYLQERRASQFTNEEELQRLRTLGEQIKQRCLSKLPDLIEQLEQNLIANGIKVHFAETCEQANEIFADIAANEQAKLMIKGKSMVSEEMELNDAMAEQGVECIESDMGEYIVQLAHEKPSHIIMPAIHQTKQSIGRLFEEHLPEHQYSEDVDELIGMARTVLRQKFEEADIGVSGVNFAVAETGTLCLVENEGNGRMSTTVPRVHIAVTGIEKVVEHLSDLPPLLSLLIRSATGQPITTYVNMISSPRKADELDGPQEVHLVLLDNGRSEAYQDEQFRKTLQCIRCAACINHCPVYARVGGHAYGSIYPGPIGKIITPHLQGLSNARDLPSASSLCGACGEVCPVKIPIPDILLRWRKEAMRTDNKDGNPLGIQRGVKHRVWEHLIWKKWALLYRVPALNRLVLWGATRFRWLMPPIMGNWTRYRSKPQIAKRSLHERMANRETKS